MFEGNCTIQDFLIIQDFYFHNQTWMLITNLSLFFLSFLFFPPGDLPTSSHLERLPIPVLKYHNSKMSLLNNILFLSKLLPETRAWEMNNSNFTVEEAGRYYFNQAKVSITNERTHCYCVWNDVTRRALNFCGFFPQIHSLSLMMANVRQIKMEKHSTKYLIGILQKYYNNKRKRKTRG